MVTRHRIELLVLFCALSVTFALNAGQIATAEGPQAISSRVIGTNESLMSPMLGTPNDAYSSSIEYVGRLSIPAWNVTVVGSRAYVTDPTTGLHIVDVANPAAPNKLGSYDTPGLAASVAVAGNYAYVADFDGLRVINIANPTAPFQVGHYAAPWDVWDVVVVGNYAYLADDMGGLRIINVADPAHPREVGFYDDGLVVYAVAVAGNYAYVAGADPTFDIINIANPTAPFQVGTFQQRGSGNSDNIALAGSYAYVTNDMSNDPSGGLSIINIVDPIHPTEAGYYEMSGYAGDVAVDGDYGYVTDLDNGLHMLNIANAGNPTNAGFYDTPGKAWHVTLGGGYIYVADGSSLLILRSSNNRVVAPFLQLPIQHSGSALDILKDTEMKGRIASWFDHSYPDRTTANGFTLYNGNRLTVQTTDGCYKPVQTGGGITQYCYDGHGGLDFSKKLSNEPVIAAAAGTVVDIHTGCLVGFIGSTCGGGFGNFVLLYHSQGYFTRYSHLASVIVPDPEIPGTPPENFNVKVGDRVGIMGTSGNSGGVHLDFMVYADVNDNKVYEGNIDKQVDPFGYLVNGKVEPASDPWVKDRHGAPSHPLWMALAPAVISFNGTQGAQITNQDRTIQGIIPPGFFSGTVAIELNNNPPPGGIPGSLRRVGRWFSLQSELTELNESNALINEIASDPIMLTVEYPDALLHHLNEDALQIRYWNKTTSTWLPLPTTIDKVNKTATAETIQLGAFDVQAPLRCASDITEPDDNHKAALELAADGNSAKRWLDSSLDEDWFVFNALGGAEFIFELAGDPGVAADLELLNKDGQTVLRTGTNSLTWTASAGGRYFVRISPTSSSLVGCSAGYRMSMQMDAPFALYLPAIRGSQQEP